MRADRGQRRLGLRPGRSLSRFLVALSSNVSMTKSLSRTMCSTAARIGEGRPSRCVAAVCPERPVGTGQRRLSEEVVGEPFAEIRRVSVVRLVPEATHVENQVATHPLAPCVCAIAIGPTAN